MGDEENARYVAAVEKRSGPPPGGKNDGPGSTGEAASMEDIPEARDTGDPQVQVAMET